MKELYSKLENIERQIKRGYITLAEGNRLMIDAIDNSISEYYTSEYAPTIDSVKAYHKMYQILFNLTKNGGRI